MTIAGDLSLYFHIPFCLSKCDYCHFYSIPYDNNRKVKLIYALKKEFKCYQTTIKDKIIYSIYFGGGTPTILPAYDIRDILTIIDQTATLSRNIEITIEGNPETITPIKIQEYKSMGINRISIGIQSLDDSLLKTLSRKHSAQDGINAVKTIYDNGIYNISVDLMYDIPNQTIDQWKNTLKQALELPIIHISLYNLNIEPHTIFYKHRESIKQQQPNDERSLQILEIALEMFEKAGFKQYEISAFCKNYHYSKHNIGYWIGRNFLGFGPSAFSYIDGKRFSNIRNFNKYCKILNEGLLPVDFVEKLPFDRHIKELLIIRLRLTNGIDLLDFQAINGNLSQETLETIEQLIKQKFIKRKNNTISLTKKGILFYDTVATEII